MLLIKTAKGWKDPEGNLYTQKEITAIEEKEQEIIDNRWKGLIGKSVLP